MVNRLAAVHGYRHYLELCTQTTGRVYAEIDRSLLTTCKRLMYRCPGSPGDGMAVDYNSSDLDIDAIRWENLTFDIALIDPFREYGTSWRDLEEGFKLIGPGGALVVHDCLPPRRELVSPTFTPGAWCGATYAAYIDFVSERDLDFYTVDTDYGCGVIKKRGGGPLRRLADRMPLGEPMLEGAANGVGMAEHPVGTMARLAFAAVGAVQHSVSATISVSISGNLAIFDEHLRGREHLVGAH
jgi:hypothetical protein